MLAYINDLTAYLIIKEVCDTINHYNDAERRAESDRDQSSDAKGILNMLLSSFPNIINLIKEAKRPDTTDAPAPCPKFRKMEISAATEDQRIDIIKHLLVTLSPEGIEQLGKWMLSKSKPDVPSVDPSLNDGNPTDGEPTDNTDGDKPHEE